MLMSPDCMAEFTKDSNGKSLAVDTATPTGKRNTMSNSKIAETVRSAAGTVPFGYTQKVDDVIAAVEGLASGVADALIEKGVEMGGNETDIRNLLVEVGLVEAEPEPAAAAAADDDTPAWAERLIGRIDALEAAARRAGVRV